MAAAVFSLSLHRETVVARMRLAERRRQRERAELALREALEREAEAEAQRERAELALREALEREAEAEAQLEALDPKTPPEPGVPAPDPIPA